MHTREVDKAVRDLEAAYALARTARKRHGDKVVTVFPAILTAGTVVVITFGTRWLAEDVHGELLVRGAGTYDKHARFAILEALA